MHHVISIVCIYPGRNKKGNEYFSASIFLMTLLLLSIEQEAAMGRASVHVISIRSIRDKEKGNEYF